MNKRSFAACVLLLGAACSSSSEHKAPADLVFVRFDPAHAPPVVPLPNDLAEDPKTGLLAITPEPDASETDKAFVAYLNTLDGFPTGSTGEVSFEGRLNPETVNEGSVRVFDTSMEGALVPVSGVAISYSDVTSAKDPAVKGQILMKGPGGVWEPGHRYAVALLSGSSGASGAPRGRAWRGRPRGS